MSKKLLMEIKLSETGCNSIPMGLEYRFCHSIETHLKRKKSLLNYTTLKISEYANEYLSNYNQVYVVLHSLQYPILWLFHVFLQDRQHELLFYRQLNQL